MRSGSPGWSASVRNAEASASSSSKKARETVAELEVREALEARGIVSLYPAFSTW
ncbi:hypothetical protein [Amycolatopsis methanolica]|uniref:Uncharacterized protein n=1 Tax=Amycolatopsis methanolica 239 TaxID=1068978 RepID=A0A076MMN0_AMYME|nr:hypothetical protein [Amycolatopsis methanolica]AIJ21959.1 hypothetical protein AMETH_1867 [Amycolatopsis methanolica 239]